MSSALQVILQALLEGYPEASFQGHTRYQCPCGFIYTVADCGEVVEPGECPDCKREIGGLEYGIHNNRRLDNKPQHGGASRKEGYFHHNPSYDRRKAERELTPLTYRVLHFLLHSAMLGNCFEKSSIKVDHLESILEHLSADWDVMNRILGSTPEGLLMDLAGLGVSFQLLLEWEFPILCFLRSI